MASTTVKLEVEQLDADLDGTVRAPISQPVNFTATLTPTINKVTWEWKKDGQVIQGQTTDKYPIASFQHDNAGKYTATAKLVDNTATTSNTITLQVKKDSSAEGSSGPLEVKVGEYDGSFALSLGVVLAVITVLGVILLFSRIGFPNASVAKGTYLESLRALTVILVACAGVFTLAAGTWLAGLEVRGRLRRSGVAKVTLGPTKRGALEEPSKVLEAASKVLETATKMRGTIAVLVAASALLLGALWTVSRDSGSSAAASNPVQRANTVQESVMQQPAGPSGQPAPR